MQPGEGEGGAPAQILLAGILNVTPDSFSDGGRFDALDDAVARGLELRAAGADWVDVGGESTRPGAAPVSADEELARVTPVVAALAAAGVPVSIDTRKPAVARAALTAGASVVNDVGGLTAPGMIEAIAAAGAGAVIMHMRGVPATMQRDTRCDDVVAYISAFLAERLAAARAGGIREIWLDPGIGFGKSAAQNVEILRRLPDLARLGAPIYVGASRKRFIGALTGVSSPMNRLGGSLGAAAAAASGGASVLRVHDVAATRHMLDVLLPCTPRLR